MSASTTSSLCLLIMYATESPLYYYVLGGTESGEETLHVEVLTHRNYADSSHQAHSFSEDMPSLRDLIKEDSNPTCGSCHIGRGSRPCDIQVWPGQFVIPKCLGHECDCSRDILLHLAVILSYFYIVSPSQLQAPRAMAESQDSCLGLVSITHR